MQVQSPFGKRGGNNAGRALKGNLAKPWWGRAWQAWKSTRVTFSYALTSKVKAEGMGEYSPSVSWTGEER